VNNEGKITATDEGEGVNRRRAAGVVAGDLEARSLTLTDTNVDPSQGSRMRLGAAGRADLQSNLRVTGNLEVTGNIGIATTAAPTQRLEVNGNVKATSFLGDGSNLTGVVIRGQWQCQSYLISRRWLKLNRSCEKPRLGS